MDRKAAKQSKCFCFKNLLVTKSVSPCQTAYGPTEYYLSVSNVDDGFDCDTWSFYDRDKLDKFWDKIVDYLYDETYKKEEINGKR